MSLWIADNTWQNWLAALLIVCAVPLIFWLWRRALSRRLKALATDTKTSLDNLAIDLLERTRFFFVLAAALYAASWTLILPDGMRQLIRTLFLAALFIQAGFWILALIDYFIRRKARLEGEGDSAAYETTMSAFSLVAKIVVWSLIVLLVLENITGIKVDALIASLGITGIAVALAVQNILGDLFAALSIALDKPFMIGDAIQLGEYSGTVEKIGLKSTRLRSVSGEQLIFSNSDLLSSRIRNHKRLERRRVVFSLRVDYQTPQEKLAMIPALLQDIISAQVSVTFDRAHLQSIGDYSLNYEVVYFVDKPDYTLYMDIQQSINLAIIARFQNEDIEFAKSLQVTSVAK